MHLHAVNAGDILVLIHAFNVIVLKAATQGASDYILGVIWVWLIRGEGLVGERRRALILIFLRLPLFLKVLQLWKENWLFLLFLFLRSTNSGFLL